MEKSWRIVKNEDGSVLVVMNNAKAILVKSDGVTGYDFVDLYLNRMQQNYRNHLIAADLILQRMMGDSYGGIRKATRIYKSYLALISMGCAFGSGELAPAYMEGRGFLFQRAECPVRSACPFNGYHPKNKGRKLVCCNPVHELPLSAEQLKIADMLVNSAYGLKEIADAVCLSESRVRVIASHIYSVLNVENRQELILLLRNKRIL